MKPDASSLVSKLTLAVLTLILACLMALVFRAYQGRPATHGTIAAVESPSPEEIGEAPISTPPRPPAINRSLPVPNTPRPPSDSTSQPRLNPTTDGLPDSREPRVTGSLSFGPTDESTTPIVETLAANGSALLAGTVTLEGIPKPEIPIDLGATCGPLQSERVTTRHFLVGLQGQLANVVVYIKSGLSRKFEPVHPGPLIDQVGCMYEPYMSAVVVGQTFQIRNSDPTLHNVHATPRLNKEFNFAQGTKGRVTRKSFPLPEMFIRLKCDVHPWMFTYISVFDHPYFAVTDTNGIFQLPAQIPAGDYVIGASHLKLGMELTQEVSLHEGEQRSIQFEFTIPNTATSQGGVVRSN